MPFHIYLIGIKWLVCVTLHIIEKYVPKRTIFGSRKLQFHCQKPHENKHYYRVSCNGKVTVSQCGNGANKNKTVQVLSVYMRDAVCVCVCVEKCLAHQEHKIFWRLPSKQLLYVHIMENSTMENAVIPARNNHVTENNKKNGILYYIM